MKVACERGLLSVACSLREQAFRLAVQASHIRCRFHNLVGSCECVGGWVRA